MTLLTTWGATLDAERVLPEYPRPQFARDSHLNLNGRWEYAITGSSTEPERYDGRILVPFSPESALSGVGRQLQPGETLWYRRPLTLPAGFHAAGSRLLLHFGAVDQTCRVYLNDVPVGGHTGGYLPFTCDITDALREDANVLVVAVQDDSDTGHHSRGKQRLRRGGIWYTAQSGIWQTVWAESVPAVHLRSLTLTPLLDERCVEVTAHATADAGDAGIRILADGVAVAEATAPVGVAVRIPIPEVRQWSPEDPFLYDVTAELGADRVRSYFGMRSFGVGPDPDGVPRLLLNGRPYFHAGILDQGYWSDGMYTAPSDEAMIADIATMKRLGFTMLRKHIKIEPLRWYHHCDRLGMLVWQDMVNGGSSYHPLVVTAPAVTPLRLPDRGRWRRWFGRADAGGRARFRAELRDTVEHLRNVVSLAVWVPFNEGWGQFDAARIARDVAELDSTRTVDHASGWHDQGGGDLRSLHVYFRRFRVPRRRGDRRVLVLSEYGGYNLRVDGHAFSRKDFGYRRCRSAEELAEAFTRLHHEQIVPAIRTGLSATVYTQLSDVEDELNGLLTYDRRVVKLPEEVVRQVNERLRHQRF
ncbi:MULTISPECIES: sugar-binding domain-containing protein [unclassified Micromonospora]|uniref:glycoside hydrolase family 2 protein n=1 Tax=unclassified Micromonospora TaxID=2617518 RepID=UPI0022B6588A|nr:MULTISPECIES: sugar-binding domain-containing protein [unclassified Micromonospora]MCZ7473592.1 glycoside hydrolase family 2 [Micromonospora sp. WMMC273]WBC04266.1 glycoside hydrolase family 2 [Micromonospora sp. WMMA1976]